MTTTKAADAGRRVDTIQNRWSTDQLMTGIRFGPWLKLLQKNHFKFSPEYAHRVAWLTGMSIGSSVLGQVEDALYGQKLAEMEVKPTPLFLLGHWRSGTTHLQNVLGKHPNHTVPTLYQVIFPSHFLLMGRIGPKLLAGALPDKRSYDNVKQGWFEAAEDEIALAKMTGLSLYAGFMFPDHAQSYERYLDFLEVMPEERERWATSFKILIKKIMLDSGGKRVVVKSCPHSARIRLILDLFPDAKFIHIHRNPYEVFASMVHMRGKVDWENFVQRPEKGYIEQRWEHTALIGDKVFERLIEDRKLIPEGNYFEVPYAEFSGNEIVWLRRMYDQLQLPDFERFEDKVTPYLDSIKGYKKNRLDYPQDMKDFVWERWRRVFDTWGYPREYPPARRSNE